MHLSFSDPIYTIFEYIFLPEVNEKTLAKQIYHLESLHHGDFYLCETNKKYLLQYGITVTVKPAIKNKEPTPLPPHNKSIKRENYYCLH